MLFVEIVLYLYLVFLFYLAMLSFIKTLSQTSVYQVVFLESIAQQHDQINQPVLRLSAVVKSTEFIPGNTFLKRDKEKGTEKT